MKEEITKAEQALLDYCRELEWGRFDVEVKNGQPVFIRHPIKDVKLAP